MTAAEFVEVTAEIERFYEKEYNVEQRKYIFEEFKNESKEYYRRVSREVFKTCKFLPKLADLVDIAHTVPKHKKEEKDKVGCEHCNSIGLIVYKKYDPIIKQEYSYAARCICENAEGISKDIPLATEIGIL